MIRAELLQYDIAYDQKEKDVRFLAKQLETHLRERFNVLISTVEYGIEDGHLVRQGTKEPFIESIRRGRDIIQKLSPDPVDVDRENAEVVGFETIDTFLSDPATSLNSKMLLISPEGEEGSKYTHNFYDIFTLREKDGARYVELTRFSSGLSKQDYVTKLRLPYENPKAEDFLSNPIKITPLLGPDEIHKLLHINHDYMEPSEFDRIWNSSFLQFFVERYKLFKNARSLKAFLNAADEIWQGKSFQSFDYRPSYEDTRCLEEKKVRQAGGQCPGKSGADINNFPFSVSDFAALEPDKYGERTFECPECGKINIRPKDEFIKNCQHCGSNKVAC